VKTKLPVSVKGIILRNNHANAEVLLLRNDRKEWELQSLAAARFSDHASYVKVPLRLYAGDLISSCTALLGRGEQ